MSPFCIWGSWHLPFACELDHSPCCLCIVVSLLLVFLWRASAFSLVMPLLSAIVAFGVLLGILCLCSSLLSWFFLPLALSYINLHGFWPIVVARVRRSLSLSPSVGYPYRVSSSSFDPSFLELIIDSDSFFNYLVHVLYNVFSGQFVLDGVFQSLIIYCRQCIIILFGFYWHRIKLRGILLNRSRLL